MISSIRKKDPIIKIALSLVSVGLTYLIFVHLLTPFFVHEKDNPISRFVPQDLGFSAFSISIVALLLAISFGLVVSYFIRLNIFDMKMQKIENGKNSADLDVLKRMMNSDELHLVEEVEKAGDITQDSLRLRLDWSKAKVSTVLSLLDRQGVIQKERSGKTYRVKLDSSIIQTKKTV